MNYSMTDDFESGQVHNDVQKFCIVDSQSNMKGQLWPVGLIYGEGF